MRETLGRAALVATGILFAFFATQRIAPVDIPWHLATGKLMVESGIFPVTNTFSWSHPDAPLYQQYPLFQLPLYIIDSWFGKSALSLWFLALWLGVVALWATYAGGIRELQKRPLLCLLAVLGVQRHLVNRPEVYTLLGLAALLLCLEAARKGSKGALVGVVISQWALALSHQMFPLGIALQVAYLIDHAGHSVLGGRYGLAELEDTASWQLHLGALAVSIAALAVGPLGLTIYAVPFATLATLTDKGATAEGGAEAAELAPVTTDPLATGLVVLISAWLAVEIWRSRGTWRLRDGAVWAMGVIMVALAVRGTSFFALTSAAVAIRAAARTQPAFPTNVENPSLLPALSSVTAAGSCLIFLSTISSSKPAYQRLQFGIGAAHGSWDTHTQRFLLQEAPPAPIMNLNWVSGNMMIPLFPEVRPFVDPRWEAYPNSFLAEAHAATKSRERLLEQLDRYEPGTVITRVDRESTRERALDLREAGWKPVHANTIHIVWTRNGNPIDLATHTPPDLDASLPEGLLTTANERWALQLEALGYTEEAKSYWGSGQGSE